MAQFRFTLNGTVRTVTAGPDAPLLWVLRELLRLTGTKFGCGAGTCGACVVLQDGRAVRSCQLPLAAAAGTRITTVEGLAGEHARVRLAWQAEDVLPCGYCQPAMLLKAAALLHREPTPADPEIDAAFAGMICRCGTQTRFRRVVRRAAEGRL